MNKLIVSLLHSLESGRQWYGHPDWSANRQRNPLLESSAIDSNVGIELQRSASCAVQSACRVLLSSPSSPIGLLVRRKWTRDLHLAMPYEERNEVQIRTRFLTLTCARMVRSFRRNGRPSSSRTTNSVVIRRLSLMCVHTFDNSSLDWNIGGRLEADEARFKVRRSAKRIESTFSSTIETLRSARTFSKIARRGTVILTAQGQRAQCFACANGWAQGCPIIESKAQGTSWIEEEPTIYRRVSVSKSMMPESSLIFTLDSGRRWNWRQKSSYLAAKSQGTSAVDLVSESTRMMDE